MKKIVFTDLDGTLTLKDTYTKFLFENLSVAAVLKSIPALSLMSLQYFLGSIDGNEVKKRTYRMFFTGYKVQEDMQEFVDGIEWNETVLERVKKRHQEGYEVVLVTASPDIYVKHICKHLGFDAFIATKTLQVDGVLSGEFDGEICNFEQKPKRIAEFLGTLTPQHTISYGNSSGDFAMLQLCDESYFVEKSNIKRYEN